MLRTFGTAALLVSYLSSAQALLCGTIIPNNAPVYSFGRIIGILNKGTSVSFSDRTSQGDSLGDRRCYVNLASPVVGKIVVHTGPCHHSTLYDYPAEKVHASGQGPSPSAAPAASPARRLLQEGDGLVEDDTWYIDIQGNC
jgi:hypothetical protein